MNVEDDVSGNIRQAVPSSGSSSAPPTSRGLHSSTFRLNLSAFCGIGGYSGVVAGVV